MFVPKHQRDAIKVRNFCGLMLRGFIGITNRELAPICGPKFSFVDFTRYLDGVRCLTVQRIISESYISNLDLLAYYISVYGEIFRSLRAEN